MKEDFESYVLRIANDENAPPEELLYVLRQLAEIPNEIEKGTFSSEDVDMVFANSKISNEIMNNILDRFMDYLNKSLEKNEIKND